MKNLDKGTKNGTNNNKAKSKKITLICILSIIITLLILCIIYKLKNPVKQYYIQLTSFDDYIEVNFYKQDNDENPPNSKYIVRKKKAIKIINKISLEVYDENNRQINLEENRFYPCFHEGENSFSFTFKLHDYFRIVNENYKFAKTYTFGENTPNYKLANCSKPSEKLFITNVEVKNCSLIIKTNKDTTKDSAKVKISITGRKGRYRNKRIWDVSQISKLNVYAILNNDTISGPTNGNTIPRDGCVELSDKQKEEKCKTIKEVGNQYLKNTADRNSRIKFKKVIGNENTVKFMINQKEIISWEKFNNELGLYTNVENFFITHADINNNKTTIYIKTHD